MSSVVYKMQFMFQLCSHIGYSSRVASSLEKKRLSSKKKLQLSRVASSETKTTLVVDLFPSGESEVE